MSGTEHDECLSTKDNYRTNSIILIVVKTGTVNVENRDILVFYSYLLRL